MSSQVERFYARISPAIRSGCHAFHIPCFRIDHLRAQQEIARFKFTFADQEQSLESVEWNPHQGFDLALSSDLQGKVKNIAEAVRMLDPDNNASVLPAKCFVVFKFSSEAFNASLQAKSYLCKLIASDNLYRPGSESSKDKEILRIVFVVTTDLERPLDPLLVSHLREIRFDPPDTQAIEEIVNYRISAINEDRARNKSHPLVFPSPHIKDRLVQSLLGLDHKNAVDTLLESLIIERQLNEKLISNIHVMKDAMLKATVAIKPEPESSINEIDQLAGIDLYLPWIQLRKKAFERQAEELKIEKPKAILFAGVSGSGKTALAKATARVLGMRLYRFDWGACKGSLLGESERKLRESLAAMEAIGEGILFMDEVEKALSGSRASQSDSGVQRGMFGYLLTWLTEHRKNIILVATCNSFSDMPAEFLRRFNEIWGVGLPSDSERWEIIKIHSNIRGIDWKQWEDEKDAIVKICDRYTGSDIVQGINEAHFHSLMNANKKNLKLGQPSVDQLMEGMKSIRPTIEKDPDEIKRQMELVLENTRPVSTHLAQQIDKYRRERKGNNRKTDI